MTVGRLSALATALLFPVVATVLAQPAARTQRVELAQAPKVEPPLTEEEKEKRDRTRPKSQEKAPIDLKAPPPPAKEPPSAVPKVAPPAPPVNERPSVPNAVPTPPAKEQSPPPAKQILPPPEKTPTPPAKKEVLPPEKVTPQLDKKSLSPPVSPVLPPAATTQPPDAPKGAGPTPEGKKDLPKQVGPGQPLPEKGPTALPKREPATPQVQRQQPPGSPQEKGGASPKVLTPQVSPSAPPAAKAPTPAAPIGAGPGPEGQKEVPKQAVPPSLPSDKGPIVSPKGEPATPPAPGQQPPGSPQEKDAASPQALPPQVAPGTPPAAKAPEGQKDLPKQAVPPTLPPEKGPIASPKADPATPQAPGSPPPAIIATPPRPDRIPRAATSAPKIEELKTGRTQRTEDDGRRTVIQEPGPGNRVIVKQDNRIIIYHDESERFRRVHRDARTERRPDGNNETFYLRSDGVRVVSVVDTNGRLIRRYRRDRDGREFNIIDNRRFLRNTGIAVGVGAMGLAIALNLPPPRVRIPREQYVVEYDRASDDDVYEALSAPPVEELERSYSLEEVRFNRELRQRMRRVDLDTITFEFGSWEVREDQFPKLERVAKAMRRLLERNPDEVFLIAAYTDAVGTDEDNLSLSDRRAEAVAQSLTEEFGLPAENLVTQGYGEQNLKIDTPGPEARNRRVEVQRITPLIAER